MALVRALWAVAPSPGGASRFDSLTLAAQRVA